jgi:hypothetical protein
MVGEVRSEKISMFLRAVACWHLHLSSTLLARRLNASHRLRRVCVSPLVFFPGLSAFKKIPRREEECYSIAPGSSVRFASYGLSRT